jgi:plastocyanin
MRHGSTISARALVAVGLALAFAPLAASASYAGVRQEGPIKVLGTATNKFDPVDVTATPDADGKITVELTSEGAPHTWENKELGIDSGMVNAGESKTFTFAAPPAGQHKIICSLHESVGMVGTLTVAGGAQESPTAEPTTAAPSSAPPASASASATVGAPEGGDDAPTAEPHAEEEGHGKDPFADIPGVKGNEVLERIEAERAAQAGAVSGFKFFTFVCVAFLAILGAAVLFSTRPRRAGR